MIRYTKEQKEAALSQAQEIGIIRPTTRPAFPFRRCTSGAPKPKARQDPRLAAKKESATNIRLSWMTT